MIEKKETVKKIVQTYFFDYHQLAVSLKTSEIMLESYKFELSEMLITENSNNARIEELRQLIKSRIKLIEYQEKTLKQMKELFSTFPDKLKKVESKVYELKIIQNLSDPVIAKKLGYCEQHIRHISSIIADKFEDYIQITKI